jgi:amino acid transporter
MDPHAPDISEDVKTLQAMGYRQELLRRMNGFSNFAISFSIICILAGCITSFQLGLCAAGGAGIALGWPVACAFSLLVAAAMGQVASAFPTAGGLYHWGSILGGRGWGWLTAWFNLIGLITVLAAINVGAVQFTMGALGLPPTGNEALRIQLAGTAAVTIVQAVLNHLGIRVTTILTDMSGYLIFLIATCLTIALILLAPHLDASRLLTFSNFSGPRGGDVWPQSSNVSYLFVLGLLLPAYTITGFDASAHTSEETVDAARNVPRAMLRAVFWSGLFGWLLLVAILLAMPDVEAGAAQGANVFFWTLERAMPRTPRLVFFAGICVSQFLCGLATLTSASRMAYAFARDGGLPFSGSLRKVSEKYRTPAASIWTVGLLSLAFTVYTPVYSTITVVCVIFLYVSYLIPIALGAVAYGGRWKQMGPWSIGNAYRPVAAVCVLGCLVIIFAGIQPPNDKALDFTLGALGLSAVAWWGFERRRFQGPPDVMMAAVQDKAA